MNVLLQPVGRSRLDDEERSLRPEERSDLLKGLNRLGEVVDAVERGDEIERLFRPVVPG
jgi:hypothetical protein